MADQTDLMDAAVDSAVAAFDVFVAGEAEDGSRLLTFDPRTPVSATVVWREGAPDALLTVTQAEQETPGIVWYALPPPAVASRTAAADAPPEDAAPVEAPKVDDALVARQQATLDEVEERIGEIEGRIAAVMLRSMTDELFDGDEPEADDDDEAKTASAGFVEPLGLVLARLAALGEPGNEDVQVRIEELSGRLDALEAAVADLLADSGPDEDLDLPDPTATTVDETLPSDEQGGGHIAAAGRPKPRPFDPSKFRPGRPVDADGDGFVYDGTIRQRPALPPLPRVTGDGLALRPPPGFDVDGFVADHPRQPGENFFDWQGRIVADLPPQLQSDVLFKTREVYPPSKFIADGIDRWQTEHGLPPLPDDLIDTPVDLEEADDVARFFEGAPDMSDDPDVRAAYEDFKAQSAEQWDFMTRPESEGGMGITVDFTDQVDPYATAEEQRNDLEQNHHLTIQSGLGGDHSGTMTQEEYDRFRAVHDVFGHAGIGSGFDRHGEYEAWLVHAAMYRGQGRRAMSTEYHGVNSAMWTGAPGSPGTGKSVLLPDEFGEPPWLRADKLGGYSDSYLLQLWYSKDQTPQLRAELVSRGILPKAAAVDDVDDVDDGSQPDSSDPVDRLIELLGLTDKFAALFDTLPLHELPEDEDR